MDLRRAAQLLSEQPAALIGMGHRKGRIAPGYDADLVVGAGWRWP